MAYDFFGQYDKDLKRLENATREALGGDVRGFMDGYGDTIGAVGAFTDGTTVVILECVVCGDVLRGAMRITA